MEYKQATSTIATLAKNIKYAVIIIISLLACNFLLGTLLWHQSGHEDIVIVPMGLKTRASITNGGVSASYLESTAIFFANERLNVTPDNISGSNREILKYVNPGYYSDFKKQLTLDSETITKSQISSTFYLDKIKSNPANLSVLIYGHLKRWVGSRYLGSDQKIYQMTFSMSGYQLLLNTFREVNHTTGDK